MTVGGVQCVFPAYAGMFRCCLLMRGTCGGFPRIRGDVPSVTRNLKIRGEFSPHTRGCSIRAAFQLTARMVFPAYAGMFRPKLMRAWVSAGFPRIRGDVPRRCTRKGNLSPFSPHTRGCSGCSVRHTLLDRVFPAYAGMFRIAVDLARLAGGFPRIRGDVPGFVVR